MAFNATLVTTDQNPITPSDTDEIAIFGFYVGATGDVATVSSKKGLGGTPTVFKSVPAGTIIPGCFCQIRATNTTATDIVGLGPT